MARLTEFGLERDNLVALREKYGQLFRFHFGADIDLSDYTLADFQRSLMAEVENRLQNELEAQSYARTFAGAEGVFLDDILSRRGIFRLGKQPSSGTAFIVSTKNTALGQSVNVGDVFTASNGTDYLATEDVSLDQTVQAILIRGADIPLGNSTIEIVAPETGELVSRQFSLAGTSRAQKNVYLSEVLEFFLENTTDNERLSYVDTNEPALYLGFDINKRPQGYSEPIFWSMTPRASKQWAAVSVIAEDTGFREAPPNTITGFNLPFSGYESSTNLKEMFGGSEVETDTEYRLRASDANAAPSAIGTRDNMVDKLQELAGVSKVVIYQNPTRFDIPEAEAFTYQTIVVGSASDSSIARTIYDNQPIQALSSGSTSVSVSTESGQSELIRFTRGLARPFDVLVAYKTNNNTTLTPSEINVANESILAYASTLTLDSNVQITNIEVAFLRTLDFNRIKDVEISLKFSDSETFVKTDLVVAFNQLGTLSEDSIQYSQGF